MKIFDKADLSNQSIITFVEPSSKSPAKISFSTNKAYFYKSKIDKGTDNINKKCDYLLVKKELDIWMLIELKGTKIDDAIKQINSTYEMIKDEILKSASKDKKLYIAISGRIQLPSEKVSLLKAKYLKQGFKKVFVKSKEIKLEYFIKERKIKQTN